jgi:precorrin-6A/cobalt-precorrin-6A reductase
MNVLVLGGTAEGAGLAEALHDRPGFTVTSSLAGQVRMASLPPGEVRIGGFGGVDGLTGWLHAHDADVLVDATHPFATTISAYAAAAAEAVGVPLVVLCRPGWTAGHGDRWHRVPSEAAAAALLPSLGERVFLTLGRGGDLAEFAHLDELWFLVRSTGQPPPPWPARHRMLVQRGPFTADAERALLREHRIDVLACRDSGGAMTAAKLVAARELGLPVVLLDRPPAPAAPTAGTVEEALRLLSPGQRPFS